MSTILISSDQVFIHVGSAPPYRITNLPSAGTYLSIEKIDPLATYISGQNNTDTFVINNSSAHRVTITVIQASPDDAFLAAAARAFTQLGLVIPLAISYRNTKYVTGSGGIEVIPTREVAADANPPVAYTLTGSFPTAVVSSFGEPGQLTTAQISNFIPPAG